MKTTLDLPGDLVREIKLRAVHEGRKLKDMAADLLRAALMPPQAISADGTHLAPKTLPLINARKAAPGDAATVNAQEFSDWVKQVDRDLEVEHYEKALGHQQVDRAQS